MELTNDFRVELPVGQAWAVLTDVERIAPCLPGAQLQEVEGDLYRGIVKVKVGPITTQYKGQAHFVDLDADKHVAVLRAEGRETRGQGSANATITATLTPDGGGTAVSVVTDLTVTGRVAQFGRGVLADVSANLLDQFATALGETITADGAPAAAEAEPEAQPEAEAAVDPEVPEDDAVTDEVADEVPPVPFPAPQPEPAASTPAPPVVRKIDGPEAKPVDLVGAAGAPVAKRVGPILALVALAWLLKKLFSRSK